MAPGRVVGLDYNPGMLAVALRVPITGASVEWLEGSALSLPFGDHAFDLVFCQLGLQFFSDRALALREMKRVLRPSGRVALSVYSAIERTPAANAFVIALDQRLGPDASKIKRAEHIFPDAAEVGALMTKQGFENVHVNTVTKRITFPSTFDYVQFQLIATPMAELLKGRNDAERAAVIGAIASDVQSLLDPEMLRDGRLSFPQEAHVATAVRVS
jgi:ubiquinone/menaquinone biosynthesis C-methylase UbiE